MSYLDRLKRIAELEGSGAATDPHRQNRQKLTEGASVGFVGALRGVLKNHAGGDRAEGARLVAVRVSDAVYESAPAGLGRWSRSWRIVERPSAALMDALQRWEATGSLEHCDAVLDAASAVAEAWQLAAAEWEQAGRSVTPRESAEVHHAAR